MRAVQKTLLEQLKSAWEIAPGKPALTLGLRSALTATAPVILGIALDRPAAVWAVAAGFTATTVDKGGAYRTRAAALGALFVLATAAVFFGAAVANHAVLAAIAMLVWATVLGFAPAYGDAATSVATASTVLFAISLGSPPAALVDIWTRVGWMAAGLGWASFLVLGLWPVRVYRPGRLAVADVFTRLAEHARMQAAAIEANEASETSGAEEGARPSLRGDAIRRDHRPLRDAIEHARHVLAATRRGRRTEAGRGVRLLVLLEIADLMFGELVAVTDRLDTAAKGDAANARADLTSLATNLATIARCARTEGRTDCHLIETTNEQAAPTALGTLLGRARDNTVMASRVAMTLYTDGPLPEAALNERATAIREAADEEGGISWLDPLRQNLSLQSSVLRHAARLGITAAIAIAIVDVFSIRRGGWVTLTVLLLLQPHGPATRKKIVQRVGGTMVGGILAALLVATVHGLAPRLAIVALFAATSTAVLQLNYGLFSIFLTPTFVLLAELSAPDASLAYVRMANTLIGGLLAFASATILWPHGERDRLPETVADVLAAVRAYAEMLRTAPNDRARVVEARRKTGLAINNAEASFERLIAELTTDPEAVAPWMTLLTYARRTVGALTTRATRAGDTAAPPTELLTTLHELEAAIRSHRAPPVLEGGADASLAADDTRLLQLVAVMTTAAGRVATAGVADRPRVLPTPR